MRADYSVHDGIVQKAVNALLADKRFSTLKADMPSKSILARQYDSPDELRWKGDKNGHIPDITAIRDGKLDIFEIETVDSLEWQHTKDQLSLFDATANQRGGQAWLVVEKAHEKAATALVASMGLKKTQVWAI